MNLLPSDNSTAGRMVNYITSPFNQTQDVTNWLWFALFTLVAAFLWNNVLRNIVAE